MNAVQNRASGTYNIGTGVETSVNELYQEVCNALDVSVEPEYQDAREGEQQRSCISPDRAAAGIGWKPEVDLALGFRKTSEWFRATH
jgi:UDP-glucose 4-epimerase